MIATCVRVSEMSNFNDFNWRLYVGILLGPIFCGVVLFVSFLCLYLRLGDLDDRIRTNFDKLEQTIDKLGR